MSIWILFILMTAATIMAVLWPLSRPRTAFGPTSAGEGERLFYEEQLQEIDRDLARGMFSPEEAASAKAEAARRLIRADARREAGDKSLDEPALRRRRATSALALSAIPLVALAIYGAQGSPEMPGQPLSERMQPMTAGSELDMDQAVARIESHLQQNPEDGQGWEVIAPVYVRMGRFDDAAAAYQRALRYLGEDADRLANFGEALVMASEGIVSSSAREAFEGALEHDSRHPKARFFLATAAQQDGDEDVALDRYRSLLADSAPDAPWVEVVRRRIANLEGADAPPADAGDAAGAGAIAGMVSGLAERLASEGGSADEWGRLVRSYAVLGQETRAAEALADARRALAGDSEAIAHVEDVAREAGIDRE
ncbi:MAG: c-type cytochrome biogenesis protein CcmI [Salinarimonas sp.]|nr:c-type cytochrome biogenesis protein CcmI [Salinarimonas sp.]